jgi:hypothetical protein
MLRTGSEICYSELNQLYYYLGEALTFYFAFLNFLMAALAVPAVIGLILDCVNLKTNSDLNLVTLLYVWGLTLWILWIRKIWARKEWELNTEFGTVQFKNLEITNEGLVEDPLNISSKYLYYDSVDMYVRTQGRKANTPYYYDYLVPVNLSILIVLYTVVVILLIVILESMQGSTASGSGVSLGGQFLKSCAFSLVMWCFEPVLGKASKWIASNFNSKQKSEEELRPVLIKGIFIAISSYVYIFYYIFVKWSKNQAYAVTQEIHMTILGSIVINVLIKYVI